ncbi:MAG TPA: DNA (cytosine-5-)-methyltransferase [Cyanobacteria bacterium UBA11159]|nr:DNA (cytosine-5-)-methyltransferase [Cyanobacteria bacterium UBA11367]HBE56501.1 DNA (cytosine-5-)-methyltransferase [Cyanobacteria bacterium UBA11366]HBK65579.1 DNA (cytosine-5-)-methyltransferase [Cyanobacteria bacterium UBA11166]HBR76957.1 DNA (cytosine-5-)-methyltransferase [Cyanobacteria bacterium UBA11159]
MANFGQKPIAIDLFAGAGGFSLGIEQAGFDVAVAVENDPIHAATYAFNFPQTEVLCTDVTALNSSVLLAAVRNWYARYEINPPFPEIDLIFGGPPCQGFSYMGKCEIDDGRNRLVFEFCRLVKEIQPRYFVMENVPGLGQKKYQNLLKQLIREFKAAGYKVTKPVQVLNGVHFGLPQQRRRLFLLGSRIGEKPLKYPKPQLSDKSKFCTVRDAIADLPNLDDFPQLYTSDFLELTDEQLKLIEAKAMPFVEKLRDIIADKGNFAYPRNWNPRILTGVTLTKHSQASIERFQEAIPGKLEPISRLRRLDWDAPAHTLRAGTGADRGSYTSPRPLHPDYPRVISVREAARLHSFPDWFRFHTTKWHGFRQIGNAVPPLLARAIGKQIITALRIAPSLPRLILDLGDPSLLEFKHLSAVRYWKLQFKSLSGF